MIDREKVIKALHDARRYLEDKEWSDRGASPHIDSINDAIALLKEQEAVEPGVEVLNEIDRLYRCPRCHKHFFYEKQKYCDQCGQAVKWE